jgi:hypothetical protein
LIDSLQTLHGSDVVAVNLLTVEMILMLLVGLLLGRLFLVLPPSDPSTSGFLLSSPDNSDCLCASFLFYSWELQLCSFNKLGNVGVLAVSSYLVGLSLLESVAIHNNSVTDGWSAVAFEFANLPALTRLVLLQHESSGFLIDETTKEYIWKLLSQVTDLYLV